MLSLWILARLLGPESFGIIAIANAFTLFLQIFIDQGLTEAIIREPILTEGHLNAAFWINMIWSIGLLILTLFGANAIANLYQKPFLAPVLRWLSIGFVISAFSSTQISYHRRQLHFRILAIRSIIAKTIAAIAAIVLAFLGYGVWSLVIQLLTMSMVGACILWLSSDWHPRIQFSKAHLRGLLNFGIKITGSRVLSYANAQLHDFVIGYYMDAISLGFFSVAHSLTKRIVDIVRNVILEVAYPAFARLQNQPQRLKLMFGEVSRLTAEVIFPIFTFIFLTVPELIVVLFGPDWLPAIQLTRILALMGGVYALIAYFSQLLMAIGQTKPLLITKIITLGINGLGLAISLRYGIVAVTAAYVASWYIVVPIYYYYVNRYINLKGYIRNIGSAFVGSLIMGAVISFTRYMLQNLVSTAILVAILFIISLVSYILTLLVISPKSVTQFIFMIKLLLNKSPNSQVEINYFSLNDVADE